MPRRVLAFFPLIVLLIASLALTRCCASAGQIIVPKDYSTIQAAINAAKSGDTILVSERVYYEHLVVNKTLALISDGYGAVIDGNGTGSVVTITADNVFVSGFVVRNGGNANWFDGGFFVASHGTVIRNNAITGVMNGILMYNSSSNTVALQNVIESSRLDGVCSHMSRGNVILGNKISKSGEYGIVLTRSNGNTLGGNIIRGNSNGVFLYYSNSNKVFENNVSESGGGLYVKGDNNIVTNNTISGNYFAVQAQGFNNLFNYNALRSNTHGLLISGANNSILSNSVSDNYWGLYMISLNESNISRNVLKRNHYGAFLVRSGMNLLYHNSFINNTDHVYIESFNNTWDNGCEGNFWDTNIGSDIDGDGICDANRTLAFGNVDRYSLMAPYLDGDLNHDAETNVLDLIVLGLAYGSFRGGLAWNPRADLNEDEAIDIYDLNVLAERFGKAWRANG